MCFEQLEVRVDSKWSSYNVMNATVELHGGCLGSFLSNHLKTNQLEVNANAKNSSSVRLREPRDLFALPPKDRDNDYSQQAAKWPAECEVAIERVTHLWDAPKQPEPFYQPTGKEVKSRPVGEENGLVIFSYNPLSAVNYSNDVTSSGDDISESSNESRSPSPYYKNFSKCSSVDSVKNSNCEDIDEELNELDEYLDNSPELEKVHYKTISPQRVPSPKPVVHQNYSEPGTTTITHDQVSSISDSIRNLNIVNTSTQFSRSCAGGSKYLSNVNPNSATVDATDLVFESRFESGNLAKAIKVTSTYYELYLRPDLYTNRSKQWFYFRVNNTKRQTVYRFAIVNLVKSDSLYNEGMKPLMYSKITAERSGEGWRRCGENICYYRNEDDNSADEDDENGSYTLTFNIQFLHDRDTVYFAHSYPYTYSDLQDYLMEIQKNPIKSKYCKLRLLCRSVAGNNVYYLSVTAPSNDEDVAKKKKAVVVSARVHPGETPSSWIMKGFMDFITGDSSAAKRLRHKFIFKLIPMLNPDGVIVGNTRNSLTGKDLNRQYRTVIKDNYPSIWYTKQMIKRLMEDCGVAMYCDMHAHSRKHNIFIYGCENRRCTEKKLTEQVFPLMVHKNAADKFCFESCKFKVQRNKEGTGRIVVWMLGVTNSYTLEASFGGSTLGSRNKTHFTIADYETMGRTFCETLLDYYDDNPIKEQLRNKIIERLTKQGSTADDPLNIALSDYSSDEGDTISNSSDNEGKDEMSELEGPCCQPLKVPPSSPVSDLIKLLKDNRKHKKSKPKCKSSNLHKRNKIQRTPLELPTTDPGSDIQFSTDDELYIDGYGTIPKTQKTQMQLEFQRKYISTQQMPPELIVTAAKNKSHEISITANKDKKVLTPVITEFPHITLATRRTNSWHNLNKSSPNKIKTASVNILRGPENDSLQFKLSLKKQVWTGVLPDMGPGGDRTRPLSWGMPPIGKKKDLQKRDENQALLEACCQKLEEWQENEVYSYSDSKNKVTINLVAPGHSEKSFRTKKSATHAKSGKIQSTENKTLKKRNPLSKLTETTQILTRLTNSKAKISLHNRKNVKSDYYNSPTSGNGSTIAPILTPISKVHRFKAGGIVASVQPLKKKKNRSVQSFKDNTIALEIEKPFVKKTKTKSKKKKK